MGGGANMCVSASRFWVGSRGPPYRAPGGVQGKGPCRGPGGGDFGFELFRALKLLYLKVILVQ